MREWTCQDMRASFSLALDGRMSPERTAAFAAHRTHCSACATAYDSYEALFRSLESLKPAAPPRAPIWRLSEAPPRRIPFWRTPGQIAAAASLLALLSISYWFAYSMGRDGRIEIPRAAGSLEADGQQGMTEGTALDAMASAERSDSDRPALRFVGAGLALDSGIEARRELHRHADRSLLALRFLTLAPDAAQGTGREILDTQLALLRESLADGSLARAAETLCPTDRAWVDQYLHASQGFMDRVSAWRTTQPDCDCEEWLRTEAARADLLPLAVVVRARIGEGLGPAGNQDFSCPETPKTLAANRRSPQFVDRFLAAYEDLIDGRPLAAASGWRALKPAQRSEAALLPLARLYEAEAFRRAGLEFEAQRALRAAGAIPLRATAATLAIAARDPLVGPQLASLALPLPFRLIAPEDGQGDAFPAFPEPRSEGPAQPSLRGSATTVFVRFSR